MKTINFHGLKLPAIGIGTWLMGSNPNTLDQESKTIQYGLNHGTNVIDTAEMYGDGDSEQLIGRAIKNFSRDKLFLISKFVPSHESKRQMNQALDRSLKNLGTDYLDLYLYHWRGMQPLSDTVANLEAAKQAGKIRHWGVSNFDLSDMEDLMKVPNGKNVFANEDLYNLGSRGIDYDLIPWQRKHRIPLIAYAPIDEADSRHHDLINNSILKAVAKKHDATVFQIMLAWCIRDGNTIAIPKTSSQKHMQSNLDAGDIDLTQDDLNQINKVFPEPTSSQPLDII
ncbi:aldehyde reductase [Philodulcilactobacillus myokoensis]|uniref:Aldehyde reductase n=1 Tax=Philodulcilactobacillus myokoensis TaxID=2929573 RepID=A0A9W6ESQ9_9LACO|nr:aldo/keto reductase [Philodulcilactobacillus myokoensis]GLB47301.1 aldehyde reductase [Philodulcilactobacillus myokoensis]